METAKNQSESMELRMSDADGQMQQVAYVGYTVRPNQGMNINFDIFNAELVAQNIEDVRASVNEFIAYAIDKAALLGIPVGK